ncbi:hypothetical protein [Dyella sp. S184]|uniref:hypothetical protein n=1 Tax=Dyella sp. S184 TaxID=1641862 RepID=UPI00131E3B4F|nr:hypothetical protein [Dyella sp. S184]
MNTASILRTHPWLVTAGMLAGLLVIVLGGLGLVRPPLVSGSLVRWHDTSHDWLLVADDQANQLTVYDAVNGRPLQRLDAKVVGDVAALAQRDGRLFVIDDDGTRKELRLPQLQRVAANVP